MNFLLYSHVIHKQHNGKTYAYGPYVKEMNLWLDEFDSVTIISPSIQSDEIDPIDEPFICNQIDHIKLYSFSAKSLVDIFCSVFLVPLNSCIILYSMFLSGHVHVRCPGNIGLLASSIQLLFPWKRKSFKYAGNWVDDKGQPLSYRIQKRILANCLLTRKSTALVYGKKPSDKKCVSNAFTATYSEHDALPVKARSLRRDQPVQLVFAGALISGKNPFVAVDTCRILNENGLDTTLVICGTGPLLDVLLKFIHQHGLNDKVVCKGNLNRKDLDIVYQSSHFQLMPSRSEGWPKAAAEAMWWGTLPVVSPVSCVPYMLDHGNRGLLVEPDASQFAASILSMIEQPELYQLMCNKAMEWSRRYTIESFHELIKSLPKA